MKHQHIVAFVAVVSGWFFAEAIAESKQCCDYGFYILPDTNTCQNGKNVAVNCSGLSSKSSTEWLRPEQYDLESDAEGEYLDVHQEGFIVREPNFCEGTSLNEDVNRTERIAVICSKAKAPTPQYEATAARVVYDSDSELQKIYALLSLANYFTFLAYMIFCPISLICLAITAILYRCIREVQDPEGTCIFHLTLNLALWAAIETCIPYFSPRFESYEIISFALQFVLVAVYAWAVALSISEWNRIRKDIFAVEPQLNRQHYTVYLAYVFPIGLTSFEICTSRVFSAFYYTYIYYKVAPTAGLLHVILFIVGFITIGIFSILSQKRIQASQTASLSGGNSLLKKARYRLRLFGKLYLILGVPSFLTFITRLIENQMGVTYMLVALIAIQLFFLCFTLLEGVLIFLLLVVCRPRMRKAIANGCGADCKLLPHRWKTEEDPEDVRPDAGIEMLDRRRAPINYQPTVEPPQA